MDNIIRLSSGSFIVLSTIETIDGASAHLRKGNTCYLQAIEDILEITHLPLLNELEGIDRRYENPFGEWTERRNVSARDIR
jgi:hypothetical protein